MLIATVPHPRGPRSEPDAGIAALSGAAGHAGPEMPCQANNPDLWFADSPADLEQAKALCAGCPVKARCLAGAIDRHEPWGVWGGEIFERGLIISRKRPRGRPRKDGHPPVELPHVRADRNRKEVVA